MTGKYTRKNKLNKKGKRSTMRLKGGNPNIYEPNIDGSGNPTGDYYFILGLNDPNVDQENIKEAYHKLEKIYNPDKNKSPGAEEEFKKINNANSVLIDQTNRKIGRAHV